MRDLVWHRLVLSLALCMAWEGQGHAQEAEWSPSELRQSETRGWTGSALGDSQQCQSCHQDLYAQWSHSAHALSSFNNPLYRASVEQLQKKVSFRASRHCGGCHDPALLIDGALDTEVDPNDARAFAGVGCLSCHAISRHTALGNASYTLGETIPLSILQPTTPAQVVQHQAALGQPALKKSQLCGSCHRSFLDQRTGNVAHLVGMDDLGPWQQSLFAGTTDRQLHSPVAEQRCQDCHMVPETIRQGVLSQQPVAGHGFAAGHTWLYAALNDAEALNQAQRLLRSAVDLQIHAIQQLPGDQLVFEVSLWNRGTGHNFPGGTRDLQDTWLTAVVRDAAGQVLGSSPVGYRLQALVLDGNSQPVRTHNTSQFVVTANDSTLGSGNSRLIVYRLRVPNNAPRPWTATVQLKHRSRNQAAQTMACQAQGTARGRRFLAGARRHGAPQFDACGTQPTTLLSEASGRVDLMGQETPSAVYRQAIAHLESWPADSLDTSLQRVLRQLDDRELDTTQVAKWQLLAARLNVVQGRTAHALRLLSPLLGASKIPQGPVQAVRGDALASVWRFAQACDAYRQATQASPRSSELWLQWAGAALNSDDAIQARQAAQKGLILQPLGLGLRRTHALSIPRTDAARTVAEKLYAKLISEPRGAELVDRCQQSMPGCRPLGVELWLTAPVTGTK